MRQPNSRNRSNVVRTRGAIAGALAGLVLFIIVFSISDLEMGVGHATLYPIHVVLAAVVILLFAYVFSRSGRSESADERSQGGPEATPSSNTPEPTPSSNKMGLLALAAFISGPVLTLAAGLVCVTLFNVHPMDRASVIGSLVTLGFIVGTLVAIVLAVAGKIG
jgi:hypothetical protein